MKGQSLRFKVGEIECIAVSDGERLYQEPVAVLFSNAPKDRLARALRAYDIELETWDKVTLAYISLVLESGGRRVLVDTGAGNLEPSTGKLMANLQAEGIEPASIDTVVLTHAHPDHIGGVVGFQGGPAFPKARYMISAAELEFWTSEANAAKVPAEDHLGQFLFAFAGNKLALIQNRIATVDAGEEIAPGITALPAPGHTPGQLAISVSSGGSRMLVLSDTVLHPVHVEQPEWYGVVDCLREQVVATRCRFLEQAVVENALVYNSHFPFPGLGHVIRSAGGWTWQPLGAEAG